MTCKHPEKAKTGSMFVKQNLTGDGMAALDISTSFTCALLAVSVFISNDQWDLEEGR